MENDQKIKAIQSILVTNTRSFTDGSSIAADLATMITQNDKRVLLIDADLRRPIIHTLFNIPNRVGLVDILQDSRPPLSVMHALHENHLFVLPSGRLPRDNYDFLGSSRMSELLKYLKERFDKIIIHGPPFFYTETSSLAAQVDGVILLIHPGYNKDETSRAIIEKFQKTGATIIGIVNAQSAQESTQSKGFHRPPPFL